MTKTIQENIDQQPRTGIGILRAFVFLVVVLVAEPAFMRGLLYGGRREDLVPIIVDTGLYAVILVFPLIYVFCPSTLSRPFWIIPRSSWALIAAITCMQILLNHFTVEVGPSSKFRAIGALAYSPLIEEIVRAALLFTVATRWGRTAAVAATAVVFASLHSSPAYAAVQQSALTLMLCWTESIPATSMAHFVMNLLVIMHYGIGKA